VDRTERLLLSVPLTRRVERTPREEHDMKVACEVEEIVIENEAGIEVGGVQVTCPRCGHSTESYGTGEQSIKRCLVLLREGCPKGESNFYIES
jgi:hypothetical protein